MTIKRFLDLFLSFLLLIIFLPIMIIVSFLIIIFLGLPIFFIQERPGLHNKSFFLIKFRTMRIDYNEEGNLKNDCERLTRFGKALRALSLDELPSFLNVLKGEMSLVGPRPLLMEYLPLYDKRQKKRHLVKPGLTGWAQVNGRNSLNWKEKFELDVWYVENKTIILDLKILALTIVKVIKREGISSKDEITMPKFSGQD